MSSASTVGRKGNNLEVAHPHNADVLLGRGKRAVNWEGNIRFRNLVKQFAAEYDNSSDPHKRDVIANQVMAGVSEVGGRFLQAMDRSNTWVAISETTARTKVKQALRDVTKMSRTKTKRSVAVLLRKGEVVAGDLEPRSIEEIVRSASTSQMVDPTNNPLLQRQLRLRRQQSMPDQQIRALQNEARVKSMPLSPYQPVHQLDFRNILRRQQDILSAQMAGQDARLQQQHQQDILLDHLAIQDVRLPVEHHHQQDILSGQLAVHEGRLEQQHQQGILPGQLVVQDGRLQQPQQCARLHASAALERLLYDPAPIPPSSSIGPPMRDDLMIGQVATVPASIARRSASTAVLDEALQAQLDVDQWSFLHTVADESVDDHSTLGSFAFDYNDGSTGFTEDDRKPSSTWEPSGSSQRDHT